MDYAQAYNDLPPVHDDGPGTFLLILLVFALFVLAIVWILYEPCPPPNPFPKKIVAEDVSNLFDQQITLAQSGALIGATQLQALRTAVLNNLKGHGVIP